MPEDLDKTDQRPGAELRTGAELRPSAERLRVDLLGMRDRLGVVLAAYRTLLRQAKRSSSLSKGLEREVAESNDRAAGLSLELKRERDRERTLLESILPAPIARRMAENAHALVADEYPEVTLLSASVSDFDRVAASLGPKKLVESLNQLYSIFDVLVSDRGMEKVRSTGERYLCVAGAPYVCIDHAQRVAELALDMQDMVHRLKLDKQDSLSMRVGIHSGPVVAGVVGERRYVWDLFGPTVRTAILIEEHCLPGRIQASGEFAARVKDRFRLTKAQGADSSLPGTDELYFLEARLPQA
jgi:class 3 adenylate cyclase